MSPLRCRRSLIVLVDLLGFSIVMPPAMPVRQAIRVQRAGRSACCSRPIRCASSWRVRSSAA